jgi:hypothetical protein
LRRKRWRGQRARSATAGTTSPYCWWVSGFAQGSAISARSYAGLCVCRSAVCAFMLLVSLIAACCWRLLKS